ncbi:MAG: SPOR domain-containing protein [Tatlockia sp.]|nr:SPOR domain-containing protein [Tatlockia sp.]
MKLVMDERVKHRLIGLAVIISIGAIFAPAIMKKSSQRIDGSTSITIQLPQKPAQPEIDMVEKREMFDATKVAHVEQSNLRENELPLPGLAKADSYGDEDFKSKQVKLVGQALALTDDDSLAPADNMKRAGVDGDGSKVALANKVAGGIRFSPATPVKPKIVAKNNKITNQIAKPMPQKLIKTAVTKSYSIQLATFTQQRNADLLVAKLKAKGYKGTVSKFKSTEGMLYKVLVGQVNKREKAQLLQNQIASALQIKGFIVSTGEG